MFIGNGMYRASLFLVRQQETEELAVKRHRRAINQMLDVELVDRSTNIAPRDGPDIDVGGVRQDAQAIVVLEAMDEVDAILAAAQGDQAVVAAAPARLLQGALEVRLAELSDFFGFVAAVGAILPARAAYATAIEIGAWNGLRQQAAFAPPHDLGVLDVPSIAIACPGRKGYCSRRLTTTR
jgi:hypothetical protein